MNYEVATFFLQKFTSSLPSSPVPNSQTLLTGFYRAISEIQPRSLRSEHAPARGVPHSSFPVTGDVISGRKSCSVSFHGGGEAN
ncbi:hypothetical protein KY285_024428 [Solanum tuberosum]|nr:hypothetical protein KY285_024428 [Solanum tuberosum]